MIDVVFLLLVFFMLAARFGITGTVPVSTAGGGAYEGPPRLVEVTEGGVMLNGLPVDPGDLPDALQPLVSAPDDAIVLRAGDGVALQRLVDVMTALRAAGFTRLVLVE
jgi:biopolymer transport protein ExbD